MLSVLSNEQIQSFKENGYLLVKQWLKGDALTQYINAIDELTQYPEVPGKYMFYYEESLKQSRDRILNRIEFFTDYQSVLGGIANSDQLLGALAQLFGEEAVLFKDKINFKLPGGDGFKPHQDIQAAWDDYTDYFINVSLSIDPHTIENGCLEVAPGHHNRGMFGRRFEPLTEDDLKGIQFQPVLTEPGDLIFFDCYIPHQSQKNMTDTKRRNMFLTYNKNSEGDFRYPYFSEKRQNHPPDIERDPNKEYNYKV